MPPALFIAPLCTIPNQLRAHRTVAHPDRRNHGREKLQERLAKLAGGVAALPRRSRTLKVAGDEQIGVDIIRRACEEPVRQIVHNSGEEGAIVVGKIRENAMVCEIPEKKSAAPQGGVRISV